MSSTKRSSPGAEETTTGLLDIPEEDIAKLKGLSSELTALDLVLERRAQEYLQPYYVKRRAILKSIPGFWFRTFGNMAGTSLHLQHQQDQDAISYLEDLWLVRDKVEPRCFTLEFYFKENPYFKDAVLKKEYKYLPPQESKDTETYVEEVTPDAIAFDWEKHVAPQKIAIQWKNGDKNLTKQYPRVNGEEADDLPSEPGSFFNFFEYADDPFDLGVAIATDLFPDAIEYFSGAAENLEDDEDSEDEDDDDEDEIDLEKPRKKQKTA